VLEKLNSVISERIGHEEAAWGKRPRLVVEIKIIVLYGVPIADFTLAVGSKEAIETTVNGEIPSLPLANHRGLITICLEDFRDQNTFAEVFGLVPTVASMAGLLAVESREQRGSRRATNRVVVKLREPQSVGRQGIDMRCLDLAAIAAEI
jgi:hypothetical protein